MLRTRSKPCARRYRSGHPVRKQAYPDNGTREVFRRDKTSLSGRSHRSIKGVLTHRPFSGLRRLWQRVCWGVKGFGAGGDIAPGVRAGTGNTFRRRFQQRACSSRQAAAQAGAGGQHGRGLKTSKGNDWNRQKYIRNITFISLYEFFLFCPRIVPALSPHCPRCPTPSKPAWMLDSSILSPLSPLFWRI